MPRPDPPLTAQEAARIHWEHHPELPPHEEAPLIVEQLLSTAVREAARRSTFVKLNLARPDLASEIAAEFYRLGYGVHYELLDGYPSGRMQVTWPCRPATGSKPAPPVDPPKVIRNTTPWWLREIRWPWGNTVERR